MENKAENKSKCEQCKRNLAEKKAILIIISLIIYNAFGIVKLVFRSDSEKIVILDIIEKIIVVAGTFLVYLLFPKNEIKEETKAKENAIQLSPIEEGRNLAKSLNGKIGLIKKLNTLASNGNADAKNYLVEIQKALKIIMQNIKINQKKNI